MVLIHFFRLIRLLDLLFIASAFFVLKYAFINPVISAYNYESSSLPIVTALSQIEFLCMVLSSCLIAAGSFAINNYFDIKNDDLLNLDYNPVGKEIPRRVAMLTHILFSITGIVIKLTLGLIVVIGIVFFINSLDFPAPKKEIEKIIPNENFKIVK